MAQGTLARVLVTGSKGQLGTAFVERLSGQSALLGVDIDDVDITDAESVRAVIGAHRPTLILNCAAFNDVDGAEARPLAAYRLNAEAVWTLAHAALEAGAVLVHYGSEFVFDGRAGRPYTEEDPPAPLSVYGLTKLVGERYASMATRGYVFRLSSLYGGHTRRSTIDWIVRQAQAGKPVRAFADRTVSPSYVPDVVEATLRLVGDERQPGLYNCGAADWYTWAGLAALILETMGRPELLEPVPFVAAPDQAARPKHCAMSSARLARAGFTPRSCSEALADYLSRCLPGAPAPQ
jgi:dTDP-4-dehydrorhamnose reductase